MDKNIENKKLDVEKEKPKQFLEEKEGTTEKSQGTSENSKESKNNYVIHASSLVNTSSSLCNRSLYSSYSDFYLHNRNSRKRKLSQGKTRNVKKMRIEKKRKSFDDRGKKLKKKVDKKYIRQHKTKNNKKWITFERKSENRRTEKSDEGYKSGDAQYNDEYNRRLDCLAKYGKNFYCPSIKEGKGLRPIYIDGSNVSFSHGQHEKFSVKGLKICIDYFRKRGHKVKAFVPNFRLRKGESTDQQLLHRLVKRKFVIITPTLYIKNQRRSPYDDWYIIQSAAANGGIVVSADNFQDIIKWNPNLRPIIEERRLVPTFVDDMIIFPVDPHGNRQNNLDQFLRF